MEHIKAIETRYKGYRFRSRLEARWAVFFDSLPEPEGWEYEKEGYDLKGTPYLPDFYLPRLGCFIEVKGRHPTEDEYKKCELFRDLTDQAIAIFHGMPSENWGMLYAFDIGDSSAGSSEWEVMLANDPYDGSLLFGVAGLGNDRNLYAVSNFDRLLPAVSSEWMPCVATDLALDMAKSARFEHGERHY